MKKRILILTLCAVMVISACGKAKITKTSSEKSENVQKETAQDLQSQAEKGDNIEYNEDRIEQHLKALPSDSDDINALSDIYILSYNSEKNRDIWDSFLADTNSGKQSEITICQFTTEGDAIFTAINYDGSKFRTISDNSRDKFRGNYDKLIKTEYSHLVILDYENNGIKYGEAILTDNPELSHSEVDEASQNGEEADFQMLFSFVKE